MQWNVAQYREFQDLADGYSLERMTDLFKLRAEYVIRRGSTLNNPHIEGAFFDRFDRIYDEHASSLRRLVSDYLSKASETERATA